MKTATDFGVGRELALVERRIREAIESEEPLITEIADYVIASGGKRIRPMVTLLAFKTVGGTKVEDVVDMAAALELIHSATLIHDDINDGGTYRRGRLAAFRKFGMHEALVAGDFLFARAFGIGGQFDDHIVAMTARVCASIAEGEIRQKRHARDINIGREEYLNIVTRKTAMPISAGAQAGALLGGGGPDNADVLGVYGMNLGIAFQIVDDILDVTGDGLVLGKQPGMDIKEGNVTLLAIHALDNGSAIDRSELIRIIRKKQKDWGEVQTALRMIREAGAVERAREDAVLHGDQALAALGKLPDSETRGHLRDLVEFVLSRNK